MTLIARIACLLCVLLATACSTTPTARTTDIVATYVVVRHAEKATDGGNDPALTQAGVARARALAARLAGIEVTAVYATAFRRTQDTGAPTAAAHHVPVTTYDASMAAEAFATMLGHDHATGTVLVVGHSNTVPGIVAALCSCTVAPIDESDYGNLYEVHMNRDGRASLLARRF